MDSDQEARGFLVHEFKGGMISIESGLELLLEELHNPDFDRQYLIDTIHKISEKVSVVKALSRDIVSQLDSASRLFKIQLQSLSLQELLTEVWIKIKEENAHSRTLHFKISLPDADIVVCWDAFTIRHVLHKLLLNAVHYSKATGGNIILQAKTIENHVLINVSDEGMGIPSETISSLFDEPSSQNENCAQAPLKHFGIGLKLCKDIVTQHHGSIWAHSQLNEGTHIFVSLPINAETAETTRPTES